MKKLFCLAVVCGLFFAGIAFAADKKIKGDNTMSNTDKVVKFLQDSKVFFIATVDGSQPRVRPFGVALNIDGKVSICTGAFKNVYKQILANPKVEISAISPNGDKWIRISGELENITTESNQQKFFAAAEGLDKLYSGDKRKDFTILSFKSGSIAEIESFAAPKETITL
ncbi:MAG: pyridoxamine 5'-phosphate oxidase family protein [Endomicrobium sp.]|jgi:uncharacterized pyridoxamine 5'-phosphate oxidase family protein|nr:pyridoxamine 5'-phosphate oxidase family protein [Endomicrobium sp.]